MDTKRLAQFQELVALEPDDTVVRFGLGELYFQAQAFAEARGDLQTVKEMQVFLRRLHRRDEPDA